MTKKILVYGEGATDYGREGDCSTWKDGPVIPLIRKSINHSVNIDCVPKHCIRKIRIQQKRMYVKGKGIQAYKLALYALKHKYKNVIFFSDADRSQASKNDEKHAIQQFTKIYKEIYNAFSPFCKEDASLIPMVALRMIECWLLADKEAYLKCYGSTPQNPRLPKKPEFIWGKKDDPKSNYPKNFISRILSQYHKRACRETFIDIAEHIEIETLCKTCMSFKKFYQDAAAFNR